MNKIHIPRQEIARDTAVASPVLAALYIIVSKVNLKSSKIALFLLGAWCSSCTTQKVACLFSAPSKTLASACCPSVAMFGASSGGLGVNLGNFDVLRSSVHHNNQLYNVYIYIHICIHTLGCI